MTPVLFADANVLIEALLIPQSAAYIVLEMVARGVFNVATCQLCVDDAENAIVAKLEKNADDLDQTVFNWQKLKTDCRLIILKDPEANAVQQAYNDYLAIMRHKADIPVLAAALAMNPAPEAILSGNRDHFNNAVANKCGIKIYSCREFIEFISEAL